MKLGLDLENCYGINKLVGGPARTMGVSGSWPPALLMSDPDYLGAVRNTAYRSAVPAHEHSIPPGSLLAGTMRELQDSQCEKDGCNATSSIRETLSLGLETLHRTGAYYAGS